MNKANKVQERGIIVYEGPSMLDGSPILAIATLKTTNGKTGDMVQLWIIRADMSPLDAVRKKLDVAICGKCPLRHAEGGPCYVNVGQAPQAVHRTYQNDPAREKYIDGQVVSPQAEQQQDTHVQQQQQQRDAHRADLLRGRKVRFGAYGDPAALPVHVLKQLASEAIGWTGYTHQMRHINFDPAVLDYCMVSADTAKSAEKAWAQKARTFRVVRDITEIKPGEIECLSDAKGLTCEECMLCDGKGATDTTPRPNIVITVHGSRKNRFLNNKAA